MACACHRPGHFPVSKTTGHRFAARASGTENIYKLYAESFRGEDYLQRIVGEAQAMIDALGAKLGKAAGPDRAMLAS